MKATKLLMAGLKWINRERIQPLREYFKPMPLVGWGCVVLMVIFIVLFTIYIAPQIMH